MRAIIEQRKQIGKIISDYLLSFQSIDALYFSRVQTLSMLMSRSADGARQFKKLAKLKLFVQIAINIDMLDLFTILMLHLKQLGVERCILVKLLA